MQVTIERVFYTPQAERENEAFVSAVSERLGIPPVRVEKRALIEELSALSEKELFSNAKKILLLDVNEGRFLRKCPGSRGVVCCNYWTIDTVSGCPFDCSYCILQHYIRNNPFITVFVNREKVFSEIGEFLRSHLFLRVGTGELADSLALDHVVGESEFFLEGLTRYALSDRVIFEFKTKSNNVERLIDAKKRYPDTDVVVGFSVNVSEITREELFTATLEERLNAAALLERHGFTLSFHFDPIVMLDRFLEDYVEVVRQIYASVSPSSIRWISMGGFRHSVTMGETVRRRFPESFLLLGEMFPSDDDNKLRYLAMRRIRFYRRIRREIEKFHPAPPLYMCMEKGFVWNRVFSEGFPEVLKKEVF